MSDFNIQSAVEEGVCHICLTGRITFQQSARFDVFIEDVLAKAPSDIIIDLREAEYIDSTMLGLLAKIARRYIAEHHHKPTLVSTREDINILIETMGFDVAFDIREQVDDAPFYLEEIPPLEADVALPETLLEAHSELMDMHPRNVPRFQTTVETLREAVKREKP